MVACSVKPETRRAVVEAISGPYPDGRNASWHTPAGEELIRSNNEHYLIAYYIAQCFKGVTLATDQSGPPAKVSIPLLLGLQPSGEISWDNTIQDPNNVDLKPTNYQKSILVLSQSISAARTQLASSVAASDSTRFLLQISIMAIGALTTIFVSIKSIVD